MKNYIITLCCLFVITSQCVAQRDPGPVWIPAKQTYELFVSPNKTDRDIEKITNVNGDNVNGSPYLDDEWQKGVIILKDNRKYENYKLKYNIFTQIVSFFADNTSLDISDGIKEFSIFFDANKTRRFVNANNYKRQNQLLYLEVLLDAKKGMLLKSQTKAIVANSDIANKSRFKQFEDTYQYYYYNKSKEELSKIKKTGSNLESILSLTPEQIKNLVMPRFDFSAEESLVSFFTLYEAQQ